MKRLICWSLAVLLLFSAVSCASENSGDTDNTETTTGDLSETTANDSVYALLPENKYDGRAFNVLVSEGWTQDTLDQIWVEQATGDVVLDSVYERNRAVEEYFDVVITPRTVVYGELADTVRREIQAGDMNADLIAHSPVELAPLAAEKMFIDINELPYADMSQPWYVQSVNEELEIAGKQYMFLTDLGFVFTSAANIMMYNRDMATDFSLIDIQQTALDGKWTLDLFSECMKNTTADLNGDNNMDSKDQYGIAVLWNEMTDTIPYSLGQKITEKDENGMPILALGSEKMGTIVTKMIDIFYNSGDCYICQTAAGDTWKTQQEMFRDGQTLFCILNIALISKRLRDMEDDYVAIPMPKYDESQDKYYTGTSIQSSAVFAVPTTVSNKEFASVIIEALSAEGAEKVLPAYIETGVKVKFSNDEKSKEVYDLILDGRIIDFGAVYDSEGMYLLFRRLMEKKSTDFASEYAATEAAAIKKYEEIYNQYLE